jgi:hypothetical protein
VRLTSFRKGSAMSILSIVCFGLVGVVLVSAVSPPARRFFKSLIGLSGAKLDSLADAVGSVDPLAQYKSEIANAAENGRNAQNVVSSSAGQLVSLKSQIEEDLKEETRLTNRLRAVVANGDPNHTAENLALQLERVRENLTVNKGQLDVAQASYDENLALVRQFEEQIVNLRKDAKDLGFQLEQSAAEAKLSEAKAALKNRLVTTDLSDVRAKVLAKINENRGKSKGLQDMANLSGEEADADLERKERAKAILAEFQAK